MSAIKKSQEHAPEQAEELTPDSEAPPLEDVSDRPDIEAAESPVRTMQAQLLQSMQSDGRRGRIMDVGRVLASASGITALLGIFVYYGIW